MENGIADRGFWQNLHKYIYFIDVFDRKTRSHMDLHKFIYFIDVFDQKTPSHVDLSDTTQT